MAAICPKLDVADILWPYTVERKYSNSSFNRAGNLLSGRDGMGIALFESSPDEWEKAIDEAFDILAEWRDLHAVPLKVVSSLLASESSSINGSPIVAERLKRYKSIRSKLRRFPETNLTTIQDIAGCRAVVQEISHAFELRERLVQRLQSDTTGPQIVEKWSRDYIANPK